MNQLCRAFGFAILTCVASTALAQTDTIAITEFMNEPVGEQNGRQWVELFNYGTEPMNLKGWHIEDANKELADLQDLTVEPGDFAIVVLGWHRLPGRDKKELFELEWLGGKSDDRVIGIANAHLHLSNHDEIIIKNSKRQIVWKVAYKNDGQPGLATFLAVDKFFPKQFGTKADPGIDRDGQDLKVTGGEFKGYESNGRTKDPKAWQSDVSKLEESFGPLYQTVAKGGNVGPGTGSPLKGNYTTKGGKASK
jgi:hypothetical protein